MSTLSTSQFVCTYHGLHEWSSRMIERLGWMVFARHEPSSIRCYCHGLQHLHSQIMKKQKETQDPDRRRDLEELALQISDFLQFVQQHFMKASSISKKSK